MSKIDAIDAIKPVNAYEIHKVLSSEKLTDNMKAEYLRKNETQIKKVLKTDISKEEFQQIMENRPLIRFKPLKNSFTKRGDDIIFAKTMNIDKKQIRSFINSIIDSNFEIRNRQDRDRIETAKAYVYRHGTKDQVVAFLQYELSDVQNTLRKLYETLDLNSGGLAGYFSRPIHRMDNRTLGKLYHTIDKALINSADAGFIDKSKLNSTAEWALVRIYQIQNNSKVIRAYKLYKNLT